MTRCKMIFRLRVLVGLCVIALLSFTAPRSACAQAVPTGTGLDEGVHRWEAGGMVSYYAGQWGNRNLGGESAFVDFRRSPRISYEGEVRLLNLNEEPWVQAHQSTYLAGVKVPYHKGPLTYYGKLLIGDGHFDYSYGYGTGNYFVVAPGGGIDYAIRHSRYTIRVVDFEYQDWVNFYFGSLRPYGVSSGFAVHFR